MTSMRIGTPPRGWLAATLSPARAWSNSGSVARRSRRPAVTCPNDAWRKRLDTNGWISRTSYVRASNSSNNQDCPRDQFGNRETVVNTSARTRADQVAEGHRGDQRGFDDKNLLGCQTGGEKGHVVCEGDRKYGQGDPLPDVERPPGEKPDQRSESGARTHTNLRPAGGWQHIARTPGR